VFWDLETWMEPPMRLLFPDITASLLQYRFERIAGAEQKARSYDPPYSGACSAGCSVWCCWTQLRALQAAVPLLAVSLCTTHLAAPEARPSVLSGLGK
jgi:hypothetical protein